MKCLICNKEFKNLGNHFRYRHNITAKEYYDKYIRQKDEGYCKQCGKETQFRGVTIGYRNFCSISCSRSNEETQEKYKQTNLRLYGVENAGSFGGEIYKNSIMEKYNVTNISQCEHIKQKKEQTFMKHFNSKNNFGRQEILVKAITNSQTDKAWQLRRKSLLKNGRKSSYEELLANLLKNKQIKFITEYKDDKYPYRCDFYLPDYKLYIEINAHWTHNNHIFDINNEADIQTLSEWKKRASLSKFYEQAIYVWTELDPKKLQIAKQNDLNFIILWNKSDIYNFVNNFPI